MEIILVVATLLGGITAIWSFYDKLFPLLQRINILSAKRKNNNLTKEILREIKEYLNAGDIIAARNLLVGRIGFENAPAQKKLEVIILEQKYGFLEDASEHLKIANNQLQTFSKKLQAQLSLVELKVNSQKHNFSFVAKNAERVISLLRTTKSTKKYFICMSQDSISSCSTREY